MSTLTPNKIAAIINAGFWGNLYMFLWLIPGLPHEIREED